MILVSSVGTITGRKQMDPMHSIWYFLEFQRRPSSADWCPVEPFAKPKQVKSIKGRLSELAVPLFVFAVVVIFGVVCFLCPTFVS